MQNVLKVKLKADDVKAPVYSTEGAACFDVYAYSCGGERNFIVDIAENESVIFGTGLYFEIPKGKCLMVYSRSGQGFNSEVVLSNGTGIIDSDYNGELMVKLRKNKDYYLPDDCYEVTNTTKIAQCMLIDAPQVKFEFVNEIHTTIRASNGFGSTDKQLQQGMICNSK